MKRVRAVLLILASDNDPVYQFFRRMQLAYTNLNPDVKTFFTYGENITSFIPNPEYDIVNPGVVDSIFREIPDPKYCNPMVPMLHKTVDAIQQINTQYDYDFLVRTNLSTFWHLDRLLKTLDTLPTDLCLAGSRLGYSPPPFIVGTGMIVTRQMASQLVEQQDKLFTPERLACRKVGKHEDRELSEFFQNVLGAEPRPLNNILNLDKLTEPDEAYLDKWTDWAERNRMDHARIKNDADRMRLDPFVGKYLCRKYYQRDIEWDYALNIPLDK